MPNRVEGSCFGLLLILNRPQLTRFVVIVNPRAHRYRPHESRSKSSQRRRHTFDETKLKNVYIYCMFNFFLYGTITHPNVERSWKITSCLSTKKKRPDDRPSVGIAGRIRTSFVRYHRVAIKCKSSSSQRQLARLHDGWLVWWVWRALFVCFDIQSFT